MAAFIIVMIPSPTPVSAADECQCVIYIQRYFGLKGGVGGQRGYAKDMAPYLNARGFGRTSGPAAVTIGAIAVFQPAFNDHFSWMMVDWDAGHVGWVKDYWYSNNGRTLTLILRSANGGGGDQFEDENCWNVTDWEMTFPSSTNSVAYFVR